MKIDSAADTSQPWQTGISAFEESEANINAATGPATLPIQCMLGLSKRSLDLLGMMICSNGHRNGRGCSKEGTQTQDSHQAWHSVSFSLPSNISAWAQQHYFHQCALMLSACVGRRIRARGAIGLLHKNGEKPSNFQRCVTILHLAFDFEQQVVLSL